MKTPQALQPGDKVGIVAPARWIPQDKYSEIINIIEAEGYQPIRGNTTYLEQGIFAGTDSQRANDLQEMIDNPEIKAIFCLRGGYGTIRIIDQIDFSHFKKNPKWLIGFSDITILHAALSKIGVESIHGQMPVNFNNQLPKSELNKLFDLLKQNSIKHTFKYAVENKCGSASGELIGGNLSIICSLIGTPYLPDVKGKILFIEDVGEYLYRVDRMIHQLKLAGVFKNIAGLVIGYFNKLEDNQPSFGLTYKEIISNAISDTDYPVAFDFPAGHDYPNYPIIMGRNCTLCVQKENCSIDFNLPEISK